jgi:type IV fimbrial biogenesis protein FimT
MRTKSEQTGFTLVEVIVVVAIVGILAVIAVPNFLSWLPNMRLNSAARDLYGIIMKAKGEAAKRNSNCTLNFNQSINGTTYAYVLFEDNNSTPGRNSEYDAGEQVIAQQQWPKDVFLDATQGGGDGLSFTDNGDPPPSSPSISFKPNAIPTDNDGGIANGSAFLTNTKGRKKKVVVNQYGNVRIENY